MMVRRKTNNQTNVCTAVRFQVYRKRLLQLIFVNSGPCWLVAQRHVCCQMNALEMPRWGAGVLF